MRDSKRAVAPSGLVIDVLSDILYAPDDCLNARLAENATAFSEMNEIKQPFDVPKYYA